jgi:hypothetical protein
MKKRVETTIKILYIISGFIPVVFIIYTTAFYFYALEVHGVKLSYGASADNESIYAGVKVVLILFESSICSMFILFPAVLFWNIVLRFYKQVELNRTIVFITFLSFICCILACYMIGPVSNVLDWILD